MRFTKLSILPSSHPEHIHVQISRHPPLPNGLPLIGLFESDSDNMHHKSYLVAVSFERL